MEVPSLMKSFANKVYKEFSDDPGNLLLWTGTIGWVLSSIAQITGIITNSKIPNDQKKFLIPQEMADAGVNIASFFLVTKTFTDVGKNLVKSGKLSTPKIRSFLNDELKSKIGTKDFDISKLDQIKNESNPEFNKAYGEFANGIGFISSTIGSIISCNIITPILRNKFAADRQKRDIAKDKVNEKQNDSTIAPYTPVIPMQNRVGIDDYRSKVLNASSGSMRI